MTSRDEWEGSSCQSLGSEMESLLASTCEVRLPWISRDALTENRFMMIDTVNLAVRTYLRPGQASSKHEHRRCDGQWLISVDASRLKGAGIPALPSEDRISQIISAEISF